MNGLINGGIQNFIQPKCIGDRLSISPVIVFVSLLVWGYWLGGIGTILAVPKTMMVLIFMENFEGTQPVAILMRYTGTEKQVERHEALRIVKGARGKLKGTFSPDHKLEENVE